MNIQTFILFWRFLLSFNIKSYDPEAHHCGLEYYLFIFFFFLDIKSSIYKCLELFCIWLFDFFANNYHSFDLNCFISKQLVNIQTDEKHFLQNWRRVNIKSSFNLVFKYHNFSSWQTNDFVISFFLCHWFAFFVLFLFLFFFGFFQNHFLNSSYNFRLKLFRKLQTTYNILFLKVNI